MNVRWVSALILSTLSAGLLASAQADDLTFMVISKKSDSLPDKLEQLVAERGGRVLYRVPQVGMAVVKAPDFGFAMAFDGEKSIQAVIPDTLYKLPEGEMVVAADNPPASGDNDFFFDLQWGHDAVNAPEAWAAGVKGAGVRVAVLDTGVDATHPDLASQVNATLGKSFLVPPLPDNWYFHGTHVAGTIAAADNAFGVIGIAPEAELVSVQVCGNKGCPTSAILGGLVYAAEIDADVVNMSLGGYDVISNAGYVKACKEAGLPVPLCAAQQRLYLQNEVLITKRVIQFVNQMGTTVVVAAGNDATDADHDLYEGEFKVPSLRLSFADYPGTIAVSATAPINWCNDPGADPNNLATYSNYGRSVIDFSAPGGEDWYFEGDEDPCTVAGLTRPAWLFDLVFSTSPGGWAWASGTSMAAPHVSGLAALLISENGGDMSPAQVLAGLKANAEDVGAPGHDPAHGNGAARSGY